MRVIKYFLSILILTFSTSVFAQNIIAKRVWVGAEVLVKDSLELIQGKRIGIVTNHSSIVFNKMLLVDTLAKRNDVKVIALFGPEHGIRGDNADGAKIVNGKDSVTGIPVYSLYGEINKPTKEMLKDVDILLFDIQDVGARFYTYISTLFYAIQAAAENNIPIIVLDRPNPIGGLNVNGPILKPKLKSFVGIAPIPIMHGMTIGELAEYFNNPELLGNNLKANLSVIKMKNWDRKFYYDRCKLNWVKPSPNISYILTAIVYPGMCLLEGTNISEGRGTEFPFLLFGAPFLDSKKVISELKKQNVAGIELNPETFIPKEIPGVASNPKYKGETCQGIKISIRDRYKFDPVNFAIKLLYVLNKVHSKDFKFKDSRFDKLAGDAKLREMILEGKNPDSIIQSWQKELDDFIQIRNKYLLY
ncbi:MAG: DUF1343 domain-containing protein [Ignavibacteriales bacterium]|nr:MAG: DUF1343 domain-containing protein [Ignavibacteriales bacterium]